MSIIYIKLLLISIGLRKFLLLTLLSLLAGCGFFDTQGTGVTASSASSPSILPGSHQVALVVQNSPISPIPTVGSTLQAIYSAPASSVPEQVVFSWFSQASGITDWLPLPNASGSTYTLTQENRNARIRVVAVFLTASPPFSSASTSFTLADTVRQGGAIAPPVVDQTSMTGRPWVGQTLQAVYAVHDPNDDPLGAPLIQWLREGVPISGAVGTMYIPTASDLGYHLSFQITPVSTLAPQQGSAVISQNTDLVTRQGLASDLWPQVSQVTMRVTDTNGLFRVGNTIQASYSFWAPADRTNVFSPCEWYRSDGGSSQAIRVTTDGSCIYAISSTDLGSYLFVQVTPRSNGPQLQTIGFPASSALSPYRILPANSTNTLPYAIGQIVGTSAAGQVLQASYVYNGISPQNASATSYQWYRACAGGASTPIVGGIAQQYTPTGSDVGCYLYLAITLQDTMGQVNTSVLGPLGPIGGRIPVATNLRIQTTPPAGQVSQVLTGWYTYSDPDGEPESGSLYQWYRLTSAPNAVPVLVSSGSINYTITSADQGNYLYFEVTPRSNTLDTATAQGLPASVALRQSAASVPAVSSSQYASSPLVLIVGRPPVVASGPLLSGSPMVGSTVTATYQYSDPDGDPENGTIVYWYRSASSSGTNPVLMTSAPVVSGVPVNYMPTLNDQNTYLFAVIEPRSQTADPTTAIGTRSASSPRLGPVLVVGPVVNQVNFAGTLQVGQLLSGSYTYSPANIPLENTGSNGTSFQWYSSSSSSGSGSNPVLIPNATASSYIAQSSDQGLYLSLCVTARASDLNNTPGPTACSAAQGPMTGRPPIASALSLSGASVVGSLLQASYVYSDPDGDSEKGSIYRWYRLTSSVGADPVLISSSSLSYTISAADQGAYLYFEVTPRSSTPDSSTIQGLPASMALGQSSQNPNAPLIAVTGRVPLASNVQLQGSALVNSVLVVTYSYSDTDNDPELGTMFYWYRSNNSNDTAANSTLITSGVSLSSYTASTLDQGKYIFVVIEPRSQTSDPTTVVGLGVQSNGLGPIDVDGPVVQNVLITPGSAPANTTTIQGAYTYPYPSVSNPFPENSAPTGTSFQWYRSASSDGGSPIVIPGATASNYTIVPADRGYYLVFGVTPRASDLYNTAGAEVFSSAVGPAFGTVPWASSVQVSGRNQVGYPLTGSYSYFDNESDPELGSTYQWYRIASGATQMVSIPGAVASSYVPTASDIDAVLIFEVTPQSSTPDVNQAVGSAVKSAAMTASIVRTLTDTGAQVAATVSGCFASMVLNKFNNSFMTTDYALCTSVQALAFSSTQDPMLGLDTQGSNFRYTKISATGQELAANAASWDCVLDKNTGLMWASSPASITMSAGATLTYSVNANLCGYHDWTIPDGGQILTLFNLASGVVPGAGESSVFSGLSSQGKLWVSSPILARGGSGNASSVLYASFEPATSSNFIDFGIRWATNLTPTYGALLMRYAVSAPSPRYILTGTNNSEVTDRMTGLTWKRCPQGLSYSNNNCTGSPSLVTFPVALQQASDAAPTNGKAWRIPNAVELASIYYWASATYTSIDNTAAVATPNFDPALFPRGITTIFWTTTPCWYSSSLTSCASDYRGWIVDFSGEGVTNFAVGVLTGVQSTTQNSYTKATNALILVRDSDEIK
jgi:hypothetical protein